MSSLMKGAVAEVQKVCVNAVWTPCYNHSLNLTLSKTSQVKAIRNCMGTLGEVVNFFNFPKRNHVLLQIVGHQLVSLCETRWVERHDAILEFLENLDGIVEALETISDWHDQATATKANTLLTSITSCEFVVSLYSLAKILSQSKALSVLLQKQDLCVEKAAEMIENLKSCFQEKRDESENGFLTLYKEALETMEKLNIEPKMPRITGRQTNRANTPSGSIEEYFRRTIYIPMLDHMLLDLQTRFDRHTINCFYLFDILPKNLVSKSKDDLKETISALYEKYGNLLNCRSEIRMEGEIRMWQEKWKRLKAADKSIPLTYQEALNDCDAELYPVVDGLLRILGTLPVSVASAERSFSCLKRLKTWLRSTMGQERLTGLALLYMNRDISVSAGEVIDIWAQLKKRRLEFVI